MGGRADGVGSAAITRGGRLPHGPYSPDHAAGVCLSEQEVCYITDLYSTCCTMKTQVEAVSVTQRDRPVCVREWAEELLESGRAPCSPTSPPFDCGSAITRCDGGRADLSATVRMRILYQDENETPVTVERSREIRAGIEGCPDTVWLGSGLPELRSNAGRCQVRIPVCFFTDVQGKLRSCKPYALWRRSQRKNRSSGHPLSCAGPGQGSACGTSPRSTAAAGGHPSVQSFGG